MSCSKTERNRGTVAATAHRAVMSRHGFTLIELMVSLVILALAGTFIYTVFITQHNSYVTQKDVSETQEDVRVSLDMLTRDLQSTGYGVPLGGTGFDPTGTTATSIKFTVAQNFAVSAGASPYITTDVTSTAIIVNNVTPFTINDKILILGAVDRANLGQYQISAINTAAKQLTLLTTATVHQGDIIVGPQNTITYSTVTDPNAPGSFLLQRAFTVNGITTTEILADHILSLQFSYTLKDGTVKTTPTAADLPNIRMVQVTISTETIHDVDKAGTHARTRTLSANVRMMNGLT